MQGHSKAQKHDSMSADPARTVKLPHSFSNCWNQSPILCLTWSICMWVRPLATLKFAAQFTAQFAVQKSQFQQALKQCNSLAETAKWFQRSLKQHVFNTRSHQICGPCRQPKTWQTICCSSVNQIQVDWLSPQWVQQKHQLWPELQLLTIWHSDFWQNFKRNRALGQDKLTKVHLILLPLLPQRRVKAAGGVQSWTTELRNSSKEKQHWPFVHENGHAQKSLREATNDVLVQIVILGFSAWKEIRGRLTVWSQTSSHDTFSTVLAPGKNCDALVFGCTSCSVIVCFESLRVGILLNTSETHWLLLCHVMLVALQPFSLSITSSVNSAQAKLWIFSITNCSNFVIHDSCIVSSVLKESDDFDTSWQQL